MIAFVEPDISEKMKSLVNTAQLKSVILQCVGRLAQRMEENKGKPFNFFFCRFTIPDKTESKPRIGLYLLVRNDAVVHSKLMLWEEAEECGLAEALKNGVANPDCIYNLGPGMHMVAKKELLK